MRGDFVLGIATFGDEFLSFLNESMGLYELGPGDFGLGFLKRLSEPKDV